MPRLNQQIQLPDGRKLGYDDRGPSDGKPLFYFHGSPSSRVESQLYVSEELLQSLNVRLIVADRPGAGLSDYQPDRRLLDWPKDVLTLADALNIERFPVLAYSLGGPYGAACAFAVPQRLTRVGIVSGAALFTEPGLTDSINEGTRRFLNLPREKPWASRLFLKMMDVMARLAPNKFAANAAAMLPEPDREALASDPEFEKGFILMVREAFRQGTRGPFRESLLTVLDWGFRPQDIQMPVLLWHGEADRNVPVVMARHLAEAIPNSQAKFHPGEGHLSLFKKNAAEIIRALVDG
ncbi:MAG TPA: alpha/beta hydrolase, partial [Anaerolineales bacterium]|nr:alpha/beta hydrolase [Anaerolineales bacterium]